MLYVVTHECIIPYSTCRGVLTGLYSHCCDSTTSVVSDYDHVRGQVPVVVSYTTGQYLAIALTTVQYGIYYPGGSFDLRHR